MTRLAMLFPIVLFLSCQTRSVTRVSPDTQIDLSGRWNDSDSRLVADKMINDLLLSDRFNEYAQGRPKKPAIGIGFLHG